MKRSRTVDDLTLLCSFKVTGNRSIGSSDDAVTPIHYSKNKSLMGQSRPSQHLANNFDTTDKKYGWILDAEDSGRVKFRNVVYEGNGVWYRSSNTSIDSQGSANLVKRRRVFQTITSHKPVQDYKVRRLKI